MSIVETLERDQPRFHWGGTQSWNAAPETLREIEGSVSKGMRTLETGCGASTIVFASKGAHHTVISPTHDEHKRVLSYLREIGIDNPHLEFAAGFSDDVLPRISNHPERLAEWDAWFANNLGVGATSEISSSSDHVELWKDGAERIFDYIFIDGAHSFPYPVIDWHYATRVLKVGGHLLLDDIPIPAVACVYRYMISDPSWRLINILDNRVAAFELVAEPAPEDYTLQRYNRRPDFGFLPLHQRSYMLIATEVRRMRRELGNRMPGLRQHWRRLHQ
ncbi:hypothetical protein SAMN05216228_10832 [Rhizobium tibeticum]|uniref:Uncharacterized protein n=1 Tax=Rhizobium tibeticum TaxID=501024 RepID=A0A1H8WWF6_9HYPH|nr:class I SAM-dependent methyltransferase [Rhizobium tibeticum]SEI21825.1 hypothetical protein RTCCBAU85039_6736 [Rhizobium tibeticum]SEP32040.1 hypothetical protein SAMN05216228_10832 [Rhizobium tibeticum]